MPSSSTEWKLMKEFIIKSDDVDQLKIFSNRTLKNLLSKSGKNLLHVSVKYSRYKITRYLIVIGCDLNKKEQKRGHTPLSLCLSINHRSSPLIRKTTLTLLLESGADTSWSSLNCGRKPPHKILFGEEDKRRTFNYFLMRGRPSEVTEINKTAKLLISKGWPLDGIACLKNSKLINKVTEKISGLKKKRRDLINAVKNKTEDEEANYQRIKDFIEPLIQYKSVLSFVLIEAVTSTNKKPMMPSIIKLLLNKGAAIDNIYGDDPLCKAVKSQNFDAAWILLDHGANFQELVTFTPDSGFACTTNHVNEYQSSEKYISNLNDSLMLMEHKNCQDIDSIAKYYSFKVNDYLSDLFNLKKKEDFINFYMLIIKWLVKLQYYGIDKTRLQNIIDDIYGSAYIVTMKKYFFEYMNLCEEEISKMKECKIENLSVFDIFDKTIDDLVPYANNKRIVEGLQLVLNSNNFKFFCDILQFKFNKAYERKLLIDQSAEVLSSCLPFECDSSHLVIRKIVTYLDFPNWLTI